MLSDYSSSNAPAKEKKPSTSNNKEEAAASTVGQATPSEDARVKQIVGIYLFVALSVLIAIGGTVYFLHLNSALLKTILFVGVSGGIGGVFYCIRGFIFHNLKDDFNHKWQWWYLYQPVTGFVFGILSYFLIVGGLLTLGSVTQVDYSKGTLLYVTIAFLAGFSTKKFTEKLDEVASNLFSPSAASAASATPVHSFDVSGFPNPALADSPGSVTVAAKDANGNTLIGYTGTVEMTSSDQTAKLPNKYKFQASDKGVHKFDVTLTTVGTQSIKAVDSGDNSIIGSQTSIIVNAKS